MGLAIHDLPLVRSLIQERCAGSPRNAIAA
jgi:hypothetical protein